MYEIKYTVNHVTEVVCVRALLREAYRAYYAQLSLTDVGTVSLVKDGEVIQYLAR